MPAARPPSIAVVGAGLTGLTAAYRLHRAGAAVRVFERADRPGGVIQSEAADGYLVEAGPNSVQFAEPALRQLVRDTGLEPELVTAAPGAQRRFVVRHGRFVPVPASPLQFFASPLFGPRTKVALATEFLRRPRVRTTDLSIAELTRDHFTQELVDYAVNPLIAGIYAGDAEKLSVKHAFPALWAAERSHGSLLRGLMAAARVRRQAGDPRATPVISFRRGLQQLTDALAAGLPAGALQLGTTVTTVIPGRPHRLVWKHHDQPGAGEFDAVVLALPAGGLAQLAFGTLGERPLAPLEHLPHPPVSTLFLGYRRDQVAHPLDGFGGLVPAVERRDVLGILFSSSLFPGRAPEGHVALTVFVGGTRQPEHARLATPQLLARLDRDLRDLVGVTGEPAFVRHHFWPRAIPQYQLGHERHAETVARCEQAHPGILIGGTARDGIAFPDCIKAGERLAQAALAVAPR